jgi:transcriptional regulator with XRE-family HTH domain
MGHEPTPTIRRWQLGQELRRLREQANVRPRAAAREIEVSESTLSRIETGKQTIKATYVKLLTMLYAANQAERERLLALCEESNQDEWFVQLQQHVPDWFRRYLGYEAAAVEIRTYCMELIDGLVQTEDYARAIGLANQPDAATRDLDGYVAIRRERQTRLTDEHPPRLHTVINEAALRRVVGGPDVMRAQIDRLIELADLPNVTVQVLTFDAGAHPAMTASFIMLGFDLAAMDTVYLENGRGAVYLESEHDLARYRWMFDRICDLSLSPDESLNWLDRLTTR